MGESKHRLGRLEAIRGFAAAVVVINHAQPIRGRIADLISSTGQEAVILFFIMSGFVIYYATLGTSRQPPRFQDYFLRRFRRIYPIFALSLMMAFVFACLIARRIISPEPLSLVGNLAMLQDIGRLKRGVLVSPYMDNMPLWSLSYEWWFYMAFFPIAVLLARRSQMQKYVVAAISVLGFLTYQLHPNQASLFAGYFFIWWSGVELAREYTATRHITIRRQQASLVILLTLTLLWSLPVYAAHRTGQLRGLGLDPILQCRHFADATVLLSVGLCWYAGGFRGFRYSVGPFAVLAPMTYALYVLHVPVLHFVQDRMPLARPAIVLVVSLVLLVPLCYTVEVVGQPYINRWFSRFGSSRQRVAAADPVAITTEPL